MRWKESGSGIPDPDTASGLPALGGLERDGEPQTEPCPYLPGRLAVLDTRIGWQLEGGTWSALLEAGWRRFGLTVFRPICPDCSACVPLRVDVERFVPSRSQRRVLRRNRDVIVEVGPPDLDAERLGLHHAFHRERTARVGWPLREIQPGEYAAAYVLNNVPTIAIGYRVGGVLAALAHVDVSDRAVSSIYGVHHPDFRSRSLGTFDILTEIDLARRLGKPWLYLGYLVKGCRSMEYKSGFRPFQILTGEGWREGAGDGTMEAGPGD